MDNGDNRPRPRMSAYAFFVLACQEEQEKRFEESVGSDEFRERFADRWKTMSEQEKRKFHQMAEEDKIRYASEMSNYKPGEEENAPVRKRRTKNPNVPKRPLVAFFWFTKDEIHKVKELMPDAAANEVIAEVSRRWNSISTETKAKYDALAAEDEARYQKELKAYKGKKMEGAPDEVTKK